MTTAMLRESIWFEKSKYDEAESHYQSFLARTVTRATPKGKTENSSLQAKQGSVGSKASSFSPVEEIAKARKKIRQTLSMSPLSNVRGGDPRIVQLEEENKKLKEVTEELRASLQKLILRVEQLEKGKNIESENHTSVKDEAPAHQKKDDDDDDFDLFGSDDDEDEDEDEKTKAALEAYATKKSKKPAVIAKSSIVLDVKPWDDETDMKQLEKCVRSIESDGLVWGASKLVDVAFGIKKLQISCVVEDDKVGTDFLEEKITEFEDFVQSVDIAAFNKI